MPSSHNYKVYHLGFRYVNGYVIYKMKNGSFIILMSFLIQMVSSSIVYLIHMFLDLVLTNRLNLFPSLILVYMA